MYTVILVLITVSGIHGWSDTKVRRFRDDFLFGVATSAYQVEGAWDVDDKGENIWDRFLHEHPGVIADGRNGDVACDSYHNYQRDVEMLRELGVDHYRFSISWSRILPTGFSNEINEKGIEYYDSLIDELIKYNIEPMVTLFHFDLPQILQDLGGWANPLSVEWFEDYAKIVFEKFGHKVKYWITMNQPNSICVDGYGGIEFAPAVGFSGVADYLCIKNVLLAHAKAYRLYQTEYKTKYKGSVGISLSLNWADSVDNKTENVESTDLFREFSIGLYMNPIWSKEGDFPAVVKKRVLQKSIEQGYRKSRLPELSSEEIKLLKGSADFLGANHYTTYFVKKAEKRLPSPSIDDDIGVELSQPSDWKTSQSSWLRSAPYGLYKMSLHINKVYDYPAVFITEHGWSTTKGLKDSSRVKNLRNYFNALLLAIEDGTDVKGYTAWSLMDNVEWIAGTSERFGLYEVNFESKEKTRKARLSALVYKRLIEQRIVEEDWKPDNMNISITKRKKYAKVEL
ncbi:myrosinase 1-like [Vanessa tameamea]|uniref:Myrosinase 1-like n=1 Tax=Vanessa tameamea TaxID=334116 RepID=A0A8B8HXJ4_VANTA